MLIRIHFRNISKNDSLDNIVDNVELEDTDGNFTWANDSEKGQKGIEVWCSMGEVGEVGEDGPGWTVILKRDKKFTLESPDTDNSLLTEAHGRDRTLTIPRQGALSVSNDSNTIPDGIPKKRYVNFTQNWNQYEKGFGRPDGEHFIGE